jgi:hypothetical protein
MLADYAGQGQPLRQAYRKLRDGRPLRALRASLLLVLALATAAGPAAGQPADQPGDDRLARQVAAFAEAYDHGRYQEAAELGAVALAMSRQAFGDTADQTGFLMLNLARVHLRTGQTAKATQLFNEARALFERNYGASHPAVLEAELGLAAAAEVDDPAAAAVRYRAVVARLRNTADADPVALANAEVGLAGALRRSGDEAGALDAYAAAADRFALALGAFHPATVQTRATWASLQPSGWIAADTLFESWRSLRTTLGDSHPETERVGLVAAHTLMSLGAAGVALETALPLAARAPESRDEAAAIAVEAWQALRDPTATIRTMRAASPPEGAEAQAKEAAAAYLATLLIRFDRPVEAALAIDRARRLTGSLSTSGAQLAEALARMAEPQLADAASLQAADLLAEAESIAEQLDPAHPRRAELSALIALVRARRALAEGNPNEARAMAREALDSLTDDADPRGVLRLRLRTVQAAAFLASGNDRLAAIAYNGLERDIAAAPKSIAAAAAAGGSRLLLTPGEAIAVLTACADYWREQPAVERLVAIQAQIAHWQVVESFWPAESPPEPRDN